MKGAQANEDKTVPRLTHCSRLTQWIVYSSKQSLLCCRSNYFRAFCSGLSPKDGHAKATRERTALSGGIRYAARDMVGCIADLHGVDQHAREAERDALRKLPPVHGNLEAIAKVDVEDLSRDESNERYRCLARTAVVSDARQGHPRLHRCIAPVLWRPA